MGAGPITRFPLLCTYVPTQVEAIIMGAGSIITRFPLLNAVLSTHIESLIFCAEVRASDRGGAVSIAVAIISLDMNTRTVYLGAAPLLSVAFGDTGQAGLSFEYKWEDAGTASVGTTDCVAAGAGRLCTDVST